MVALLPSYQLHFSLFCAGWLHDPPGILRVSKIGLQSPQYRMSLERCTQSIQAAHGRCNLQGLQCCCVGAATRNVCAASKSLGHDTGKLKVMLLLFQVHHPAESLWGSFIDQFSGLFCMIMSTMWLLANIASMATAMPRTHTIVANANTGLSDCTFLSMFNMIEHPCSILSL